MLPNLDINIQWNHTGQRVRLRNPERIEKWLTVLGFNMKNLSSPSKGNMLRFSLKWKTPVKEW